MSNLYCFIDHHFGPCGELVVPQALFEMGICEKQGQSLKFKAVGIVIVPGGIISVLPKGCIIPELKVQQQQLTSLLIRTIIKYNRRSDVQSDFIKGGSKFEIEPLETAQWLIQDFQQSGIIQYQKQMKELNGKGRIYWANTINRTFPYLVDGRMYYLDLITKRVDSTTLHELSKIHQYILQSIGEKYGWLFGFHYKVENFTGPKMKVSHMRYLIQKALNNTYVDREIELFKRMLDWIDRHSDQETYKVSMYITEHFHVVWEQICGELLGNSKELHRLMPNPYWSVENRIYRTSQRADILIENQGAFYIFDAKYYSLNKGLNQLPGWGDLVKQFFYAKSLNRSDETEVYNAFLFPSTVKQNNFRFYGFASVEQLEEESRLGKIPAYMIDVEYAMKSYLMPHESIRISLMKEIATFIKN